MGAAAAAAGPAPASVVRAAAAAVDRVEMAVEAAVVPAELVAGVAPAPQ